MIIKFGIYKTMYRERDVFFIWIVFPKTIKEKMWSAGKVRS